MSSYNARQVVQRGGVVGVPLAQGRTAKLHRLLVERLGLGVPAHRVVQQCQVVQRGGVVGVPLAQGLRRSSIACL